MNVQRHCICKHLRDICTATSVAVLPITAKTWRQTMNQWEHNQQRYCNRGTVTFAKITSCYRDDPGDLYTRTKQQILQAHFREVLRRTRSMGTFGEMTVVREGNVQLLPRAGRASVWWTSLPPSLFQKLSCSKDKLGSFLFMITPVSMTSTTNGSVLPGPGNGNKSCFCFKKLIKSCNPVFVSKGCYDYCVLTLLLPPP